MFRIHIDLISLVASIRERILMEIEETRQLTNSTDANAGYWKYRLEEMEHVLKLIDLNLTLRNACSTILHKTV